MTLTSTNLLSVKASHGNDDPAHWSMFSEETIFIDLDEILTIHRTFFAGIVARSWYGNYETSKRIINGWKEITVKNKNRTLTDFILRRNKTIEKTVVDQSNHYEKVQEPNTCGAHGLQVIFKNGTEIEYVFGEKDTDEVYKLFGLEVNE